MAIGYSGGPRPDYAPDYPHDIDGASSSWSMIVKQYEGE